MKRKTVESLEAEITELIATKAFLKHLGEWDDQLGDVFNNLIDKCSRQRLSRRKHSPKPHTNNTQPTKRNDIKLKL